MFSDSGDLKQSSIVIEEQFGQKKQVVHTKTLSKITNEASNKLSRTSTTPIIVN